MRHLESRQIEHTRKTYEKKHHDPEPKLNYIDQNAKRIYLQVIRRQMESNFSVFHLDVSGMIS